MGGKRPLCQHLLLLTPPPPSPPLLHTPMNSAFSASPEARIEALLGARRRRRQRTPDPSSLQGPRLTQCAGGSGRSAPALKPRSDIHRRSQSAAPAAAPALPRPAREHPRKAGGGCSEEGCLSWAGKAAAGTRAGPARPPGGGERWDPGSAPVGAARRPAGPGSGAPTW
ncbi:unnamed protein product [Rangifer tarandus platyrhynchus]|uniref:Uncharacterized protein n=1 Tax=Rangifer tarandus platyrhynchus TaxID=3082113 RepID=A0AC59YE38_RANTA